MGTTRIAAESSICGSGRATVQASINSYRQAQKIRIGKNPTPQILWPDRTLTLSRDLLLIAIELAARHRQTLPDGRRLYC